MDYKNLLFEEKNSIGFLTINRPDKLNALNNETLEEIKECLVFCKENSSLKVLIITGAGEKAFVAGADISEISKLNPLTGKVFSEKGQEVFNLMKRLDKPVIAAVNGFALGGGCELALACHIRIASENAKFGQPEVNLGIIPGYAGTQRLTRLLGSGLAAELILTGDVIDAQEALKIGLINKIVHHEKLITEAVQLAEKICKKPQNAVNMALRSIVSCDDLTESEGQNYESSLFALCCGTEDFREGTTAFLEKRKPNFKNS
jgi:enoyl-CoA hydratase